MEKAGENLTDELFTFRYPGREPRFLDGFISKKPEILDYLIYDVNLTTGRLLYLSKGGMGVTREPYIVRMHQWIKTSTVRHALEGLCERGSSKWRFMKSRERFNERPTKLGSWADCAELYLLWLESNFTHRYRLNGYEGSYLPSKLKLDQLLNASQVSREKDLLFREEDLFSFKENVITDDMIVYSHLPREFGKFGAGWVWSRSNLEKFVRVVLEFASFGRKILISAQFEVRGRVELDYRECFPDFDYIIVPEFKDSSSFLGSKNSEIYLFNF